MRFSRWLSLRIFVLFLAIGALLAAAYLRFGNPSFTKFNAESYWKNRGVTVICDPDGNLRQFIMAFDRSYQSSFLREISGSNHLSVLWLKDAPVTDKDLLLLSQLPCLLCLDLGGTRVEGSCLSHLANEFGSLNYIYLQGTDVSDTCIPDLVRLKHLKYIDLSNTKISSAGIEQLKQQLPDVQIHS